MHVESMMLVLLLGRPSRTPRTLRWLAWRQIRGARVVNRTWH